MPPPGRHERHGRQNPPERIEKDSWLSGLATALEAGKESRVVRQHGLTAKDFRDTNSQCTRVSKIIAYATRHAQHFRKDNSNIIDSAGWVSFEDLVLYHNLHNRCKDPSFLAATILLNDKGRFTVAQRENYYNRSERTWHICAAQGHSIEVDESNLELITPDAAPHFKFVCHGTTAKAYQSIARQGLSIMTRKHIHFASSPTAVSGWRSSADTFIHINLVECMEAGMRFYISENEVILTTGLKGIIPPRFFSKVSNVKLQPAPGQPASSTSSSSSLSTTPTQAGKSPAPARSSSSAGRWQPKLPTLHEGQFEREILVKAPPVPSAVVQSPPERKTSSPEHPVKTPAAQPPTPPPKASPAEVLARIEAAKAAEKETAPPERKKARTEAAVDPMVEADFDEEYQSIYNSSEEYSEDGSETSEGSETYNKSIPGESESSTGMPIGLKYVPLEEIPITNSTWPVKMVPAETLRKVLRAATGPDKSSIPWDTAAEVEKWAKSAGGRRINIEESDIPNPHDKDSFLFRLPNLAGKTLQEVFAIKKTLIGNLARKRRTTENLAETEKSTLQLSVGFFNLGDLNRRQYCHKGQVIRSADTNLMLSLFADSPAHISCTCEAESYLVHQDKLEQEFGYKCCWSQGSHLLVAVRTANGSCRALASSTNKQIMWMIVEVTFGEKISEDDNPPERIRRSNLSSVRICIYHVDHTCARKSVSSTRSAIEEMFAVCGHLQCDIVGGDGNGAAFLYHKRQANPSLTRSSLHVSALNLCKHWPVNEIHDEEDHDMEEDNSASLTRPTVQLVQNNPKVFFENQNHDDSLDCMFAHVFSWGHSGPFDKAKGEYKVVASERFRLLDPSDLFLSEKDASWHRPILLTIRTTSGSGRRQRTDDKAKARWDEYQRKLSKAASSTWSSNAWTQPSSSWNWSSSSSSSSWDHANWKWR